MSAPDLSGEVLEDRYQIFERISEGAMGVVYRGIRIKLERQVAIKVMHSALPGAMQGRQRFEREAQLMARLDHPHVVSIIDFGIHHDKPYVVMELVRGVSLYEMLSDHGRFESPRAVDVMRQVLSGLAHAHEQGIIHRDIKPANVMITPKAPLGVHARILDFGLARMLGASTSLSNGVAVGTPSYMAPEQCRGDDLDARVDIYACGIVLFEMLTGKKPLTATDPIQTLKRHIEEPPPLMSSVAPGSYGRLEGVVARALAKAPGDRFPSAIAMAEALDAAVAGSTASEATAVMQPQASSGPRPTESSLQIPITVATSAFVMKPPEREPPHQRPVVRPNAPARRKPYLLLLLLAAAAATAAVVVLRDPAGDGRVAGASRTRRDAPLVAPDATVDAILDPAAELAATARQLAALGKGDAAFTMLADGRRRYPDRAVLPLTAAKLYFAKYWWTDGLENLREAIRLDPTLRQDSDVIEMAIQGFITTPSYDGRLGRFVLGLGPSVVARLDEIARTHRNPEIRARAAALARRVRDTP